MDIGKGYIEALGGLGPRLGPGPSYHTAVAWHTSQKGGSRCLNEFGLNAQMTQVDRQLCCARVVGSCLQVLAKL